MSIICSCGCKVSDFDDTITCSLASYDRSGEKSVTFTTLCKKCYDRAYHAGEVLEKDEDIDDWLSS